MRWTNVGRLFLLLFLVTIAPAAALAQTATGEVQSIGFNGLFRPDCWVPMVVRIKPASAEAGNYQIRVYQHDADGDRAVYVRPITVSGSATAATQSFWMYFLPEPLHKGLPDQPGSLKELQKALTVFLCNSSGKQLAQLPVTSQLDNVDPYRESQNPTAARGHKLVLAVSANGGQQPQLGDFSRLIGVKQDFEVANLRIRDLPESPLGYEPVDAVLWLDGDPATLDDGGAHGLAALQDYVRFGGHLIVTQPTADWHQTATFGDLLPVTVTGVGTKQKDFEPLRSMAQAPDTSTSEPLKRLGDATNVGPGGWGKPAYPVQFARATARPGALVEKYVNWTEDGTAPDLTPYLARKAVGLGQVTWVAQPLTADAQPRNQDGWPYVWLTVLGWRNDAYVVPPPSTSNGVEDDVDIQERVQRYKPGSPVDIGRPLVERLDLSSKGAWLIVLAIGFFIVYWLVAGPGTYGYLMAKRKQSLSWFFFAAVALVATAVTVGVVKLVLRGPPEVRHLTTVRIAPGQPAIAYSKFGLYIPRDGDQTIELSNTLPGQLSYVSALAEHPQVLGDVSEFPSPLDYDVPVRDLSSTETPSLTVPYRSSLKKFQARWVGDLPTKIGGGGLTLDADELALPLKGTLTNDTGFDLSDVYLAWHVKDDHDWVVYVPSWAKGTPLDVQKDLNGKGTANDRRRVARVGHGNAALAEPGDGRVVSDEVAPSAARGDKLFHCWQNYWYAPIHGGDMSDVERKDLNVNVAVPILSLFDRLPPMPNYKPTSVTPGLRPDYPNTRVEFLARGGRMLDASQSIAAGQLLVLAQVKGPLPIPVQVDGSPMAGEGTTLYQFLLPIDRGNADKPATQPVEK